MKKLLFLLMFSSIPAFAGISGTNSGIPVLQQDLIGHSSEYYPNRHIFINPGEATARVQNVKRDLWNGPTNIYVYPSAPMQMQVVSTSANDTSAGTGARIIDLHYLDQDYNEQEIYITLNGTTPVLTVPTNILRINNFHVTSVGSVNGTSAGNISIQSVGGAVTYGFLSAGDNRARHPFFTVPAGKTAYITHWQASSGSATGNHFVSIVLNATTHDGSLAPGVFIYQDGFAGQNSAVSISLPIPLVLPATTDIKLTAISDGASADATAVGTFMGWYE